MPHHRQKVCVSIKCIISMGMKATYIKHFYIEIVQERPRMSRPTKPQIPQHLFPISETRDTTYQITQKEVNKVLRFRDPSLSR